MHFSNLADVATFYRIKLWLLPEERYVYYRMSLCHWPLIEQSIMLLWMFRMFPPTRQNSLFPVMEAVPTSWHLNWRDNFQVSKRYSTAEGGGTCRISHHPPATSCSGNTAHIITISCRVMEFTTEMESPSEEMESPSEEMESPSESELRINLRTWSHSLLDVQMPLQFYPSACSCPPPSAVTVSLTTFLLTLTTTFVVAVLGTVAVTLSLLTVRERREKRKKW